ncbi:MAG: hypothetical protein ACKVKT_06820 [Rhodospirillales bacterium]
MIPAAEVLEYLRLRGVGADIGIVECCKTCIEDLVANEVTVINAGYAVMGADTYNPWRRYSADD